MNPCKAISLWQPWASLVVAGVKRIETRSWAIPPGRYLVHAAGTVTAETKDVVRLVPALADAVRDLGYPRFQCSPKPDHWHGGSKAGPDTWGPHLPTKCALGFVTVVESVPVLAKPREFVYKTYSDRVGNIVHWFPVPPAPAEAEYELGDFTPGRFACLLTNPVPLDRPVPLRGRQAVWTVDLDQLPGVRPPTAPLRTWEHYERTEHADG